MFPKCSMIYICVLLCLLSRGALQEVLPSINLAVPIVFLCLYRSINSTNVLGQRSPSASGSHLKKTQNIKH